MASINIATRGSALALAQSNAVLAQCRATFPDLEFALKIIKTTGDKLQTASMAQEGKSLPKGLFTKELEVALLEETADLAVHSLKDLPTELPTGLRLGSVGKRADVRDVLLYRDISAKASRRGFAAGLSLDRMPSGSVVATSSTRRRAQLLEANAGIKAPDIRGNVLTRIQKLAENAELDGTILALAGLTRLNYAITGEGYLTGENVPTGVRATVLSTEVMLPCVGQGAVGIEIRDTDERLAMICARLNDLETFQCVTAEREFLSGMGGGCQSPVAAHARIQGDQLTMTALSFAAGPMRRAEASRTREQAAELGRFLATQLKS